MRCRSAALEWEDTTSPFLSLHAELYYDWYEVVCRFGVDNFYWVLTVSFDYMHNA